MVGETYTIHQETITASLVHRHNSMLSSYSLFPIQVGCPVEVFSVLGELNLISVYLLANCQPSTVLAISQDLFAGMTQ